MKGGSADEGPRGKAPCHCLRGSCCICSHTPPPPPPPTYAPRLTNQLLTNVISAVIAHGQGLDAEPPCTGLLCAGGCRLQP